MSYLEWFNWVICPLLLVFVPFAIAIIALRRQSKFGLHAICGWVLLIIVYSIYNYLSGPYVGTSAGAILILLYLLVSVLSVFIAILISEQIFEINLDWQNREICIRERSRHYIFLISPGKPLFQRKYTRTS